VKRLRREDLILPVTAAIVLLADRVTKGLVLGWLHVGESRELFPGLASVFRITHVTNTGAAFGLFPQLANVYVIVAAVVILVILVYYRHIPKGERVMRLALGLALGGALGNMTDRLTLGHVVDFLDLTFWPLEGFAVFNVADSSISAGCALLVVTMLWEEWQMRRGTKTTEAA